MHCSIDLRLATPAIVNALLYLLLNSQEHLWDWEFDPLIKMASLILGFLILYLMLSFLELPLSLVLTLPNHQMLGFRNSCDFSLPLALALLASFLLPPPPFWYAYLICIVMFCPRWSSLFHVLKGFIVVQEETLESVVISSRVELPDDDNVDVLNDYIDH